MKKILYLHAGAEMYGADKVLLELVDGLDKEKFEPYVILPENGQLVDELKKKSIRVDVLKYPILRRRIFNPIGLLKYLYEYVKYSIKLSKIVKKNKIDLVHVNTTAVLEGVFIKKVCKTKIIWHVHEIIMNPVIVSKFITMIVGAFSDRVVTVSEATKNHLVKTKLINPNMITVIYNGVDGTVYSPNNPVQYLYEELQIPESSIIIGMIGRVNSWKGQIDFVRAVAPILIENSNVYGVMVGGVFEGEEYFMDNLLAEIHELGVESQIKISDFRNDIANVHALFDIFVLPSINPDPLPTVVLESMASQKPIVGYAHGGIKEMVKDEYNGLLCIPNNPENLRETIKILLDNPEICSKYGENSLIKQNNFFDKSIYVKNFDREYSNLLGDK